MERANLKERRKDIYDRIVAEWHVERNHAAGGRRKLHTQF